MHSSSFIDEMTVDNESMKATAILRYIIRLTGYIGVVRR